MGKYQYSESEKDLSKVLKYHDERLKNIPNLEADKTKMNESISSSELLLKELGLASKNNQIKNSSFLSHEPKQMVNMQSWEDILKDANQSIPYDVDLHSLFTDEELKSNERYINHLREDFNTLHKLDKIDYSISTAAGVLADRKSVV